MTGVCTLFDSLTGSQIYDFVVRLPADGYIMSRFDNESTSYKDLFLPGQPFKSLYAIHALTEYIEGASRTALRVDRSTTAPKADLQSSQEQALRRSLQLVVQALSDPEVLGGSISRLQIRVVSSLMQKLVQLVQGTFYRPFISRGVADGINKDFTAQGHGLCPKRSMLPPLSV